MADMIDYGPEYQIGQLTVDNEELIKRLDLQDCQVGLQIASDGRIWLCVNGMAYLRFKPSHGQRYANIAMAERTLTTEDEKLISDLVP